MYIPNQRSEQGEKTGMNITCTYPAKKKGGYVQNMYIPNGE